MNCMEGEEVVTRSVDYKPSKLAIAPQRTVDFPTPD